MSQNPRTMEAVREAERAGRAQVNKEAAQQRERAAQNRRLRAGMVSRQEEELQKVDQQKAEGEAMLKGFRRAREDAERRKEEAQNSITSIEKNVIGWQNRDSWKETKSTTFGQTTTQTRPQALAASLRSAPQGFLPHSVISKTPNQIIDEGETTVMHMPVRPGLNSSSALQPRESDVDDETAVDLLDVIDSTAGTLHHDLHYQMVQQMVHGGGEKWREEIFSNQDQAPTSSYFAPIGGDPDSGKMLLEPVSWDGELEGGNAEADNRIEDTLLELGTNPLATKAENAYDNLRQLMLFHLRRVKAFVSTTTQSAILHMIVSAQFVHMNTTETLRRRSSWAAHAMIYLSGCTYQYYVHLMDNSRYIMTFSLIALATFYAYYTVLESSEEISEWRNRGEWKRRMVSQDKDPH
ncbi:hypothetical protein CYMTET_37280 [Cymbomonas tetramitiformis]|uniref:Uncharacterized protein n=1 Tax=Cymbomonas tetramitiformis TaxID=36881 RepID=A0AAE0CE72_9CHLO|nr:hypothetical protein CYMTET_37280 [Cymbomonas tetramitiformis]